MKNRNRLLFWGSHEVEAKMCLKARVCHGVGCKEAQSSGWSRVHLEICTFWTLLPSKSDVLEISLFQDFFSPKPSMPPVLCPTAHQIATRWKSTGTFPLFFLSLYWHTFFTFSAHPSFSCIGPNWAVFQFGHKGTKWSPELCSVWRRSLHGTTTHTMNGLLSSQLRLTHSL